MGYMDASWRLTPEQTAWHGTITQRLAGDLARYAIPIARDLSKYRVKLKL